VRLGGFEQKVNFLWKTKRKTYDMAELPGSGTTTSPLPPLPNTGGQNASPDTVAVVARWNAQVEFRPIPPEIDALLRPHPEYLAWMQGSIVGSLRISQ